MSNDLAGALDLHVHAAPDVRPRKATMLEVARAAASAGMRAIVLKSHHEHTAGHAAVLSGLISGITVIGGVTLNRAVGGLNPEAVETTAALGGRIVWMPTFTAAHHLRVDGKPAERGVTVLDERGRLSAAAYDVLDVVAARGLTLATGHLSPTESALLVPEARRRGVRAVIVTHPEASFIDVPLDLQQQLAGIDGVYFERCYNSALRNGAPSAPRLDEIARAIRAVGVATTILSSDLGQPENPFPTDGLRAYHRALLERGFTPADLDAMARTNPAAALGL
jgi:hypothetical protein